MASSSAPGSHPAGWSARRRQRTVDPYGEVLSTTTATGLAYADALDRLLSLEDGVAEALNTVVDLDPEFALGHAVAATVLAEEGAPPPVVREHLHAARRWSHRATEREASFVTAAVLWCSDGLSGDAALVRHVVRWPRDVYALSLITPSIASAGVGDGVVDVWPLLDDLVGVYGDDWWLTAIRAFARTEQHRWEEAEELALAGLAARPGSGHAAHAYAHVLYETGRHRQAIDWIDDWRAGPGVRQRFGGHFSWHAALAELSLGDIGGVRARFDRELAGVVGNRALVDGGSLLARCAAQDVPLGGDRLERLTRSMGARLLAPTSPFLAWHVAVVAGLGGDAELLDRGEDHARLRSGDPGRPASERDAWAQVAALCRALRAAHAEDHARAAALLASLGDTTAMGGSPAQRELLEDLGLSELRAAGEHAAAARVAAGRLRRRPCAFDERLCASEAHLRPVPG